MSLTRVCADAADLAIRAAGIFAEAIGTALTERGRAIVVLAGGNTPNAAYAALAALHHGGGLPLGLIDWLPGDERWVPVDHPDSNEGMIRRTLLEPTGAPAGSLRSWLPALGDPADCAARFARGLAVPPLADGADLAILGIGEDGHTASLLPGAVALLPGGRRAAIEPGLPVDAAAVLSVDSGAYG